MSAGATPSGHLLPDARARTQEGSYGDVVRLLEAVPRDELLAEPELGYHLAYAWRRTGASLEALRLCEELDVPVRRTAADWLIRRRLNLEAMLRFDRGDLPAAEELWNIVIEHASAADDQALLSAAHNNLGVIHTLRDRVDSALAAYNRALLAAQRLGDRRGVAQAHQNLAILFREMHLLQDADEHFGRALREARIASSDDVRGRVEEERALLLLDLCDVPLAEVTGQRALRILTGIDDLAGQGEALRVLGIIALRQGSMITARSHLDRGRDLAVLVHNPLLHAETLEALALLEAAQGSDDTARIHQDEATALFGAIQAQPWGQRIRARTRVLAGFA